MPWWQVFLIAFSSAGLLICCFLCLRKNTCCACMKILGTPGNCIAALEALEGAFSAAHADPYKSRLSVRPHSDHPKMDLVEAIDCCCCLPVVIGVALLGLADLARLICSLYYAAESLSVYQQTGDGGPYAGLMDDSLRNSTDNLLWASVLMAGIKSLIWLLVLVALACTATLPLRALVVWIPFDLIYSCTFAALHTPRTNDLCLVDLRIHALADGQPPTFRRAFLQSAPVTLPQLGAPPPALCDDYREQETMVVCIDCAACAVLGVWSCYMASSLLRRWERGNDPVRMGKVASRSAAPYRV